jgi:hypothetical protein
MVLPHPIRKRIPRAVFALTSRLDGSWAEATNFLATHQLGLFETLAHIKAHRISLARLGDGELLLALNSAAHIVYQQGSDALQQDLRCLLKGDGYEDTPLLVGIPGLTVAYYRLYWAKYWRLVRPLLASTMTYGNISVSREALFRQDAEAGRLAWRAVWDACDVCFVTGKGSRFDVLPALFDNVASQRMIHSLPAQAYDDLPRVLDEIRATVPKSTLVLISLGPAATVLAGRLAREGYWAIDLGHISNAYLTIASGAPRAESLPHVRGAAE